MRGCMAIVVGAAGTGKTVLAQQIAFATAGRGETAIYCTGFAESHEKLVRHNRGFAFFDQSMLGKRIQIESLTDLLAQGPRVAEDAVVATAAAQRAALVVLDGFGSMRGSLSGDQEVAQFLHSLGARLAHLGTTTLVTLGGDADHVAHYPEMFVCDAILSLRRERHGSRHHRFLEAMKIRGVAALDGVHSFTIDGRGIVVSPRLEAVVERDEPSWMEGRTAFGVPALDAMLNGGVTVGTITLAVGSPGSGKTLLGLHFLSEGARHGEPGLYVGFLESAAQTRGKAEAFRLGLGEAERSRLVRFAVFPSYDVDADQIAAFIRAEVERRGVKRLVVDSLAGLRRGIVDGRRTEAFLAAFATALRAQSVTTVVPLDVPMLPGPELHVAAPPLSALAENVLLLRHAEYQGTLLRTLSVVTMRFSDYDHRPWEYTIEPGTGLHLVRPAPPAAGSLAGLARSPATDAGAAAGSSLEASL